MTTAKLSRGLDYYKPTMSQLEYEQYPDVTATFTLKNRSDRLLSEYVSPEEIRERLGVLQAGWQPDEIAYLASLAAQGGRARFTPAYLDYLADSPLPPIEIGLDERGDIAAQTTGAWPLATFWETVVMSELNELYFQNKLQRDGLSLSDLYREGDRRLSDKIDTLQRRPDIKFSDFGTRRRFSYDWHKHVVERLATECPDNLVGTSNVYLAYELGLAPIGTFAHELPMGYAALADARGAAPLSGHSDMLRNWRQRYGDDLSTALTDTFTTDFFFADFSPEQAEAWQALRHDSGDPVEFGERVIAYYERLGIDPRSKTIVFSDGLDIDTIISLADHFDSRINAMFGWGTTLTNDLGVQPNNIVMKLTDIDGTPTVKLSDSHGKHTGPELTVRRYQTAVRQHLGAICTRDMIEPIPAQPEALWHPGPNYAADAVVISNGNRLLLIKRPSGEWALPGGFVGPDDHSSLDAATRELAEETNFTTDAPGRLIWSGKVDDPRSSTDRWIESDAYLFDNVDATHVAAGDDAVEVRWWPLDQLPPQLYGSHERIVVQAIAARSIPAYA